MTKIKTTKKNIPKDLFVQRIKRLAALIVDSNLPQPILDELVKRVSQFSLLEIDLLIDALAREQEEWQTLESELSKIKKEAGQEKEKLLAKQRIVADDFVKDYLAQKAQKTAQKTRKELE